MTREDIYQHLKSSEDIQDYKTGPDGYEVWIVLNGYGFQFKSKRGVLWGVGSWGWKQVNVSFDAALDTARRVAAEVL